MLFLANGLQSFKKSDIIKTIRIFPKGFMGKRKSEENKDVDDKKAPVTLKDIAKEAGVSTAAVSKALQNKPDIGESTSRRIRAIADSLGYKPNHLAKSLRIGHSDVLGVLIPDNCNPYNALVIKGVEKTARERGYTVIVANTDENPDIEREVLRSMVSMQVAGILAIPIRLSNYEEIVRPLIFMSRYPYHKDYCEKAESEIGREFSYIVNDDYLGEYLAASHLANRGYKDIFLITGGNNPETVEGIMNLTRLKGYRKALEDSGIPFKRDRVRFGVNNIEDSYKTVLKILKNEPIPLALCMNSDYCALGALSAINEMGLEIPGQVAIVGYDDIEMALYAGRPITTIHQEKYKIGSESAAQVIAAIEAKSDKIQRLVLPPALVARTTT